MALVGGADDEYWMTETEYRMMAYQPPFDELPWEHELDRWGAAKAE